MNILMTYGADAIVIFASLGAMVYCMILSRRLSRLTSFDKGLGSAIAVMSSQVDEMKAALKEAKAGSDGAGQQLHDLVHQAREISSELEMMIAACHDFAEEAITVQSTDDPEPSEIEEMAEQEPPRSEDDTDTAEPVFGSRRAERQPEPSDDKVQPLFRRRAGQSG
ncbi:DUF6468 domain-containing protein [Gymnodinialimonas sp. 2305UL16-5]|uniref:DUF6468 domain-containing protein n=1 Tax=Gymnodinialimonas mytili TaxID=3126503 RepID=UPI0030A7C7F6